MTAGFWWSVIFLPLALTLPTPSHQLPPTLSATASTAAIHYRNELYTRLTRLVTITHILSNKLSHVNTINPLPLPKPQSSDMFNSIFASSTPFIDYLKFISNKWYIIIFSFMTSSLARKHQGHIQNNITQHQMRRFRWYLYKFIIEK